MAKPSWKTWRKILVAGGLGLAVAYGVYFAHWMTSADEGIAEADRLDPGWQLEELERKREVIPDEDNGALVVLAAAKLWPAQRSTEPEDFWAEDGMEQSIVDLPPEVQLNAKQRESLKKELEKTALALLEARKLIHLSRGRFPTTGSRQDGTAANAAQESRRIATLLQLESILQAQDNRQDQSLATTLGILNAGRSVGDEPYTISQLIRMSCEGLAVRSLERILAQGKPTDKAIVSAQELFENESRQSLLLMAIRGDRADVFQKMSITKVPFLQPWNLGGLFRLQTKCVEAAKALPEEQLFRVQQLKAEAAKFDPMSSQSFKSFEKTVAAFIRSQAGLRCAIVALALERYRHVHKSWPDNLVALVPEFLRELPTDPFNGSPLKYRRFAEGVVIYSVGPDGQDNGGKLDRQNPKAEGTDIGFQLWDVAHRRQPWRPVVKKAEEAPEK